MKKIIITQVGFLIGDCFLFGCGIPIKIVIANHISLTMGYLLRGWQTKQRD